MKRIDKSVLFLPTILVICISALLSTFPDVGSMIIDSVRNFLGNELGVYYLIFGIAALCMLAYLAFSKIGKIRLGTETDKPMNTLTWGILIFTSTMAADILFYSFHEWTYYYNSPMLLDKVVAESEKLLWSSTYPLFHWSFIPWSFYLVLAVVYAYMFYVAKRQSKQKISEACRPILNDKADRWQGKLINIVAVFGLLCGTSTTFSVTTPLMTSIVCKLFGLQKSHFISICILLAIAIVYTFAVLRHNGISMIAKLTTILFSVLIALFFIIGNPRFIIESGVQGIGNMLQNFVRMSTWTDPTRATNFPQDWTIFYWAYWIAWCVATPFFIAKISKGRTIRQTIIGGLIAGLLGTFTSFITFGGFGMSKLVAGTFNMPELINEGLSPADCIVELISTSKFSVVLFIVLLLTMIGLYASTFDALTDVMSAFSYKKLNIDDTASKKIKIFWAAIFIVLPIALLFSDSTTQQIMSMSIIGAFPLTLIMILVVIAFFKDLHRNSK